MENGAVNVRVVEDFPAAAAAEIAGFLKDGARSVALCGGSTPRPVYERLAGEDALPWADLRFYFGDERCVPPDHERSNYRMVMQTLLAQREARVHRMEAERSDRDEAARAYEELLPEPLDLLLLGMGADGHTASLFPGSAALRERRRRVVAAGERLTITPPVIESARAVLVLVAGAEKADTVAAALHGPVDPERLPVQLARGDRATWILDRLAAGRLNKVGA